MMLSWTIDPIEKIELIELAKARRAGKNPAATRRRSAEWSDISLEILGLLGEHAVAECLGSRLQDSQRYRLITGSTGDGGVDFWYHDGTPIVVKYGHRWKSRLYVEERPGDTDEAWVDVPKDSILMLVHGRCVKNKCMCEHDISSPNKAIVTCLAGWIGEKDFRSRSRKSDFGYGGRYWVESSELSDARELIQ